LKEIIKFDAFEEQQQQQQQITKTTAIHFAINEKKIKIIIKNVRKLKLKEKKIFRASNNK